MLISIDLGFGFTKVVNEHKKISFPSVVAPALSSLTQFGEQTGYVVNYQWPGGSQNKSVFVGELAQKSGRALQASLSRNKFIYESSIVLALTGAYLADAEGVVDLALGLPLAYYKQQKDLVIDKFKKTNSYIQVDGGKQRYISFGNIEVLPQGVGVVFSLEQLPESGLVGILDIGYFTTDFLLVECNKTGLEPLPGYAGSLEIGVSTVHKLFQDKFNNATGGAISLSDVQSNWNRDEISYRGQLLNIQPFKEETQTYVIQSIIESLKSNWSEKFDFLSNVIAAGGGSLAFSKQLKNSDLPGLIICHDPSFANANGFYNMAKM